MNRLRGDSLEQDIFELVNPAGKSATDEQIQAIVLTREVEKGGIFINNERKKNNLNELPCVFVDIVNISENSENDNKFANKMSSSLIR